MNQIVMALDKMQWLVLLLEMLNFWVLFMYSFDLKCLFHIQILPGEYLATQLKHQGVTVYVIGCLKHI
jgi:hypothetical protein